MERNRWPSTVHISWGFGRDHRYRHQSGEYIAGGRFVRSHFARLGFAHGRTNCGVMQSYGHDHIGEFLSVAQGLPQVFGHNEHGRFGGILAVQHIARWQNDICVSIQMPLCCRKHTYTRTHTRCDCTNRCFASIRSSKPHQYHEKIRPGQAQMIFASFSPGGLFLAAGSADHHVRVYLMSNEGPKRILETEAHSDTVDSIQWAHNGLRFISGSKDGSAHVWHFESQQWKSLRLQMSERLASCPPPVDENKKLKVTMVGWDLTDKLVVTAVNDFTVSDSRVHCSHAMNANSVM